MWKWFKRKPTEGEVLASLVRAATEGERSAEIRRAFSTIGIRQNETEDDAAFIARGCVQLVRLISRETSGSKADLEFVLGVALVVFCDHAAYVLSADFEMAATFALTGYYSIQEMEKFDAAFAGFKRMSESNNKGIIALGQNFANWCHQPTLANFRQLQELLSVLVKHLS